MACKTNIINPEAEVRKICNWIKDYFIDNGPDAKAVVGISGGKDSTIAAALLALALGPERVIGVLMPEYNQTDIDDALKVCEVLKIDKHIINIGPVCSELYEAFSANTGFATNSQITTNTPARVRMTTLYMVAAAVHGRVVNTCNRSEDYVGYSTKYGDLAGDFSIFKNYCVRDILAIGDYLGLPDYLVHKTPSDGMCGKTDEDNLGFTYEELDAYIIDEVIPTNYETYKKIVLKHKNNLHKECINLPVPDAPFYLPDYTMKKYINTTQGE